MDGPWHLMGTSEGSDGLGVDENFTFAHTLEHHAEVEPLPLCREVESIEVASVAVAQVYQVAMVLLRAVAAAHLMVGAAVGIGKCDEAHIAAAYLSVGERLIAGMLFLVFLVFLHAAPISIGLVSPDGVHGISLEQAHVSCRDDIGAVVLEQLVLRVAQVESHLIAEITDSVSPPYFEIPSPGLQAADVHCRNTDTDSVGQLQTREHVVVVFPIIVERSVQAAFQQSDVNTHVGGLDGFPGLVF